MILKKIHSELFLIRKELQAIRKSKEFQKFNSTVNIDGKAVQKAIRDNTQEVLESSQNYFRK